MPKSTSRVEIAWSYSGAVAVHTAVFIHDSVESESVVESCGDSLFLAELLFLYPATFSGIQVFGCRTIVSFWD